LFFSCALYLTSYPASNPGKLKQMGVLILLMVTLALILAALTTSYWYISNSNGVNLSIGLRSFQLSTTNNGITDTYSGLLSELSQYLPSSDLVTRLIGAGNIGLATGSVGISLTFFSALALLIGLCAKEESRSKYMGWCLILIIISALVVMMGAIFYAKRLFVGYSFILYTGCSLLLLLCCFIFMVGRESKEEEPQVETRVTASGSVIKGKKKKTSKTKTKKTQETDGTDTSSFPGAVGGPGFDLPM